MHKLRISLYFISRRDIGVSLYHWFLLEVFRCSENAQGCRVPGFCVGFIGSPRAICLFLTILLLIAYFGGKLNHLDINASKLTNNLFYDNL